MRRVDAGSRRRAVALALVAFAVAPRRARAQPTGKRHRIGFLGLSSPADYAPYLDAFLAGLRDLGYEDGRNVLIEYRWADLREERLPALARELVQGRPDVIVAHSIGVRAAQQATSTIPIVMGVSADPVGLGMIKSLARPGGNTTGIASRMVDAATKRLELLKEAAPRLSSVAVLSNPAVPAAQRGLQETEAAARRWNLRVRAYDVVADPTALGPLFGSILRERPDGLVVQPDPITGKHGAAIAAFATANRLPSIGGGRQYAVDGGLLSFGADFVAGWRLAARYVDKVLRGADPATLPVEQPDSFEFVVNLRAAKALGLTLAPAFLLRATEILA